jgi:hypothetical protein
MPLPHRQHTKMRSASGRSRLLFSDLSAKVDERIPRGEQRWGVSLVLLDAIGASSSAIFTSISNVGRCA